MNVNRLTPGTLFRVKDNLTTRKLSKSINPSVSALYKPGNCLVFLSVEKTKVATYETKLLFNNKIVVSRLLCINFQKVFEIIV